MSDNGDIVPSVPTSSTPDEPPQDEQKTVLEGTVFSKGTAPPIYDGYNPNSGMVWFRI